MNRPIFIERIFGTMEKRISSQFTGETEVAGDAAQFGGRVGDVVFLKDLDLTRNKWPMARVKEVFPSEDGLVRKANAGFGTTLLRPVTKLIHLVKADV